MKKAMLLLLLMFVFFPMSLISCGHPSRENRTQYHAPRIVLPVINAQKKSEARNIYTDSFDVYKINANDFLPYGKIYNELKTLFNPRDEFETTDSYRARCESIAGKEYTVKLELDSQSRKSKFQYVADKSIAAADVRTDNRNNMLSIEVSNLANRFKEKGSYVGSNAFGVTRRVNVIDLYFDLLVLDNKAYKDGDLSLRVECDPSVAKDIVKNYGIAIKFHVSCDARMNGVAVLEKNYIGPTIDSPTQATFHYRKIPITLDSLILYNEKTKNVIVTRTFEKR